MKKKINLLIAAALLSAISVSAQQKSSFTFKVEELIKPKALLPVKPYQNILEGLIDADRMGMQIGPSPANLTFNIVAKSDVAVPLVAQGNQSFYQGAVSAYAQHRPFTLSPDMIWLLICQGFAYHVNNNPEDLRKLFVDFDGKTTLDVKNDKIDLDNPKSPWDDVFDDFSGQIAKHAGTELTTAFTADFSTTTAATKIASQITLMNALKSFFEFELQTTSCGIPEFTLEGKTQDWERILTKTEALRKYKLDWWVDELMPVLKQFVNASKGKVNKSFWRRMVKIHTGKNCGSPSVINGWIIKFYPYNDDGKRNNLKVWDNDYKHVPNEIIKVDLRYTLADGAGHITETPLELWAGFVGLEQDNSTFSLKPVIGWMVRKKDSNLPFINKLKENNARYGSVNLRVGSVPPELLTIGPIKKLQLYFTNTITIPDQLAKIRIGELALEGNISAEEIKRIVKLFPNSVIFINRQQYYP